jgi:hypothetical protein
MRCPVGPRKAATLIKVKDRNKSHRDNAAQQSITDIALTDLI